MLKAASLTMLLQETAQCTPHSHTNRCEPRPGYHDIDQLVCSGSAEDEMMKGWLNQALESQLQGTEA